MRREVRIGRVCGVACKMDVLSFLAIAKKRSQPARENASRDCFSQALSLEPIERAHGLCTSGLLDYRECMSLLVRSEAGESVDGVGREEQSRACGDVLACRPHVHVVDEARLVVANLDPCGVALGAETFAPVFELAVLREHLREADLQLDHLDGDASVLLPSDVELILLTLLGRHELVMDVVEELGELDLRVEEDVAPLFSDNSRFNVDLGVRGNRRRRKERGQVHRRRRRGEERRCEVEGREGQRVLERLGGEEVESRVGLVEGVLHGWMCSLRVRERSAGRTIGRKEEEQACLYSSARCGRGRSRRRPAWLERVL